MPRTAHKQIGDRVAEVDLQQIAVGERVVVFPHEICPVDGTVIEGETTMGESYLTGEPFMIEKIPGVGVFSGAVNGQSAVTIEVGKLPVDSRYAKIMRVMEEAEQHRPAFRRIGDRLGAWYTPLALIVASAGWLVSGDADRFLAVLVIATPCPLLIAIPVAIIGAISLAASRRVIVKNPAMLERITSCRTLIFDKTGTLTYGKPSLTDIWTSPPFTRHEVLQLAASLERYSRHPLSLPSRKRPVATSFRCFPPSV
jgi:P-type E1-E2 ATPase